MKEQVAKILGDRIPSMHYVYDTVRIDLSTRRTENILADLRSVSRSLLVRTIPGGLHFCSGDFPSPSICARLPRSSFTTKNESFFSWLLAPDSWLPTFNREVGRVSEI